MINLRQWQSEFLSALADHDERDFLLVACPAAGKTIAGAAAAAQTMTRLDADQLVVVVPTLVVRDQWVETLNQHGFTMLAGCPKDGLPEWVHGAVLTYAELVWRQQVIADACRDRGTVVIMDEIHHAGKDLVWGRVLFEALADAQLRLMLSGTPFRSDEDAIPWVRYQDDGTCVADFTYDYKRAVREGVCRPIEFRTHDGTITWSDTEGDEQVASFNNQLDVQSSRRRLRASLDPAQPYLRQMLQAAHNDLLEQRKHAPSAAGLVICETQEHARKIDRVLQRISGEYPSLAISDNPRAHELIRMFANAESMWLVSVRMVAEGVDVPRLSTIAFCSGGTELMVKQVAGRALRSHATDEAGPALVHMPADPELLMYAEHLDNVAGVSTRVRVDRRTQKVETEITEPQRSRGAYKASQFRAIAAVPAGEPISIIPPQPPRAPVPVHAVESLEIQTPDLPPSPSQVAEKAQKELAQRGEVLRLLSVWTNLRRELEPAFQMASAHAELYAAVGPVGSDAEPAIVDAAVEWLQDRLRDLVAKDPKAVVTMARNQRRLRLAADVAA